MPAAAEHRTRTPPIAEGEVARRMEWTGAGGVVQMGDARKNDGIASGLRWVGPASQVPYGHLAVRSFRSAEAPSKPRLRSRRPRGLTNRVP